tara:strand:+ start:1079 stop:1624 length:546 start_codon:yes stop_codon:yes gene_type:complete
MKLTIKQVTFSLIFFLVASMYMVFAYYYFTQRDTTAEVIVNRVNSDLVELSYILSKQIKKEPISTARTLLDRKAANNKYLSAIAIFKSDQLVMTTDPGYSKIPNASDLYLAAGASDFALLHEKRSLIAPIYYYQGKSKKTTRLFSIWIKHISSITSLKLNVILFYFFSLFPSSSLLLFGWS